MQKFTKHIIFRSIIRLGEHDLSDETEAVTVDLPVAGTTRHPSFDTQDGTYDIAVVRMERDADFSSITALNISNLPNMTSFFRIRRYYSRHLLAYQWAATFAELRGLHSIHRRLGPHAGTRSNFQCVATGPAAGIRKQWLPRTLSTAKSIEITETVWRYGFVCWCGDWRSRHVPRRFGWTTHGADQHQCAKHFLPNWRRVTWSWLCTCQRAKRLHTCPVICGLDSPTGGYIIELENTRQKKQYSSIFKNLFRLYIHIYEENIKWDKCSMIHVSHGKKPYEISYVSLIFCLFVIRP